MRGIDWKRSEVDSIADLARSSPVIGVASIHEIPARQFQSIRRDLRGKINIKVSKKRLISRAFSGSERDKIEELETNMGGEVALLFTQMNPFRLFRILEDRKVQSPAKPGHRPPEDVWVRKGDTPFSPGPIVSQLQKVGIPARIERGRVVVLEDTLFVKAGEQIDRARCDILSELGIEPMRIGLDVAVVYENGMIFDRSVLDVDVDELTDQLSLAARQAFNLSFNSGFATETTIAPLLLDAHLRARSLSLATGMPTDETMVDLLSLAHGQMLSLAALLDDRNPDAIGEDLTGQVGRTQAGPKEISETGEEAPTEDQSEDDQQDEEKEEGESVGLDALFG